MQPGKAPSNSMELDRPTLTNRFAKKVAPTLSRLLCSDQCLRLARMADAYLNFLLGKGAGTGWDMAHEITAARSKIHRDDPIIFDIGANVGEWAEQAVQVISPRLIYMFEPSPECRARITTAAIPSSKLIPFAVGEVAGRAVLHSSSVVDGSASLHVRDDSYFADRTYSGLEIEVVTLDQVIASENVDFIDFLKMDIEGHELFALKGARDALSKRQIGALSFEFGSGNINSRTYFRDFWKLLRDAGFKLWRITPGGKLVPIDSYYEDLEYFRGVSNYIAELVDHPFNRAERQR